MTEESHRDRSGCSSLPLLPVMVVVDVGSRFAKCKISLVIIVEIKRDLTKRSLVGVSPKAFYAQFQKNSNAIPKYHSFSQVHNLLSRTVPLHPSAYLQQLLNSCGATTECPLPLPLPTRARLTINDKMEINFSIRKYVIGSTIIRSGSQARVTRDTRGNLVINVINHQTPFAFTSTLPTRPSYDSHVLPFHRHDYP